MNGEPEAGSEAKALEGSGGSAVCCRAFSTAAAELLPAIFSGEQASAEINEDEGRRAAIGSTTCL
ncbi:MAG: hypothetical protein ACRDAK_13020 [Aeromonas veronii]